MWNAGLDESQAGIKIARRNINNLRYADGTTLMAQSKEELKCLLMKVKEESEKADLKLSIHKTKVMASSSITSWQMGKMWKQCQISFSWAPKLMETVTVVTWSQKMPAPWKNSYDKPRQCDIALPKKKKKNRDITLPTKVRIVKAMVFSVVMYMWDLDHKEGWMPKNWCFLMWCCNQDCWDKYQLP